VENERPAGGDLATAVRDAERTAWVLNFPHNRAGRSRLPPPAADRLDRCGRLDTENVSVNNARR